MNEHLIARSDDVLDVRVFNRRKNHIATLRAMIEKLESALSEAEARHEVDVAIAAALSGNPLPPVQAPVAALQPTLPNSARAESSLVRAESSLVRAESSLVRAESSSPQPPAAAAVANTWQTAGRNPKPGPRTPVEVPVAPGLTIPAMSVQSFADVRRDGHLYYVAGNAHFAVNIDGTLFHGNIGRIFSGAERAVKIKDCHYSRDCTKNGDCDFYHDPMVFPESTDCRNYVSTSWIYAHPLMRGGIHKNMRHIGDSQNLAGDIAAITDQEVSRLRDQVAHDILCALLAVRRRVSPS